MLQHGSASYAEALRILAEPGVLPAVYFCMAGKDRTGVFSALVLGLLGVPDDVIVSDYALTAEVLAEIHARSRAETPDVEKVWERLPRAMIDAVPETMEGLLAAVHAQLGGWTDFATLDRRHPGDARRARRGAAGLTRGERPRRRYPAAQRAVARAARRRRRRERERRRAP